MSDLTLELADGKAAFAPGEPIRGRARWRLGEPPEAVEIRLFWYTEGKGDQDVGGIESIRAEGAASEGSRDFEFTAPASPHSFSGRLITLLWALELVVLPDGPVERREIVVAPGGQEVRLAPAGERLELRDPDAGEAVETLAPESFDGAEPLEPS